MVHNMTHGVGTASPAGTSNTSAGCGAPFQQWVGATHKTEGQNYFFTAALFGLSSILGLLS